MTDLEPRDPDYEAKVRESFARQSVMELLDARLLSVAPGLCEIELPYRRELTQQHGYLHAGVAATIADSAGGYASFSLMPPGSSILSIEFKVNLLAPGTGERFVARGRVVRPGRLVSVTEIEVEAHRNGSTTRTLFGLQTTLCLPATAERPAG